MTFQKLFVLLFFLISFFISFSLFFLFNDSSLEKASYEIIYGISEDDECNLKTFHYNIDGTLYSIEFDYMIKQFHYWAFYDCNYTLVYRFDTRHLKNTKPLKNEKNI